MSASIDGTIRIWCLEKLIELYNFNLITDGDGGGMDDTIERIQLINDKLFAVFMKSHKNRVDIGQISHLAQSYYISKSNIRILSKSFLNQPCWQQNKTESLMLSFDNNSTLLLWPEDGSIKSIVYPPPTPTTISQVIYCMSLRRVFLLLASGSLCVYKVHNRETATLDKLVLSHHLKDYEGKKLSQQITAMNIISVEPPVFDCEIFSELHKFKQERRVFDDETSDYGVEETSALRTDVDCSPTKKREDILNEVSRQKAFYKNDDYLVAGTETGMIIFVNVHKLD